MSLLDSRQLSFDLTLSTNPTELPNLTPAKTRYKYCIKCKEEKVLSEFTWAKHQIYGYRVYGSVCLSCKSVWKRDYLKGKGKQRDIEWRKQHYAKNPTKRIIEMVNRRAAKLGVKEKIAVADWEAVLDLYGKRCVYCGLESDKLQVDHIWPLSLAKKNLDISKFATNDIDNIVPSCGFCNRAKLNKPFIVMIGWKNSRLQ